MGLVGTYDGTVRAVDGIVCAGCGCCIPGNEPTAAFSYEQTAVDPCTIDLTDESTVHANCTDGEIVEWKWYKNDETTPFSTSQHPTGVEVEAGDEIRLWIKDSCGCTDEVVMEIACDLIDCTWCPDLLPSTVTVTISGMTGSYAAYNGTHVVPFNSGCGYQLSLGGANVIFAGIPSATEVFVTLNSPFTIYRGPRPGSPCRGSYSAIPLFLDGGVGNESGTVSMTI